MFQRAVTELSQQEQVLAGMQSEYESEQQAMAEAMQGRALPLELAAYDVVFRNLSDRMEEQRERIELAEQALEEAREALAERSKQRKVMEKLRENAKETYDDEARRIEINDLDEVGTSITIRNKMNG